MAKLFYNNGLIKGTIGHTTYRVSGGTNQAYQKPHPTDARSKRQVMQRCSYSNASHFYGSQKKAHVTFWESKASGQNNYNMFLKHNLGADSIRVYLTKQEKDQGYCIAAPYVISSGSLETLGIRCDEDGRYVSGVSLGNLEISENTTIAKFSAAVITNGNSNMFMDGDEITFCECLQYESFGVPCVKVKTCSLQINTEDARRLWQVVPREAFQVTEGHLSSLPGLPDGAYCWIHTRETEHGKVLVSSERLCCNNILLDTYTSDTAFERAAQSYGGYNDSIITGDGKSRTTGSALGCEVESIDITAQVAHGEETMGSVQIGEEPAKGVARQTVPSSTQVSLRAHAKEGYRFKQWQDGNTNEERLVVALIDKTYTAEFEKITHIAKATKPRP